MFLCICDCTDVTRMGRPEALQNRPTEPSPKVLPRNASVRLCALSLPRPANFCMKLSHDMLRKQVDLEPAVAKRLARALNGEFWAWRASFRAKKGGDLEEWRRNYAFVSVRRRTQREDSPLERRRTRNGNFVRFKNVRLV